MTDTNVLINLIHVDRLSLLGALSGYDFVVPAEVESEVITPQHFAALARAFDAAHLRRRPFSTVAELTLTSCLQRWFQQRLAITFLHQGGPLMDALAAREHILTTVIRSAFTQSQ